MLIFYLVFYLDFKADIKPINIYAGLQMADYITTMYAMNDGGAVERNPLLKDVVQSPVAFMLVKYGEIRIVRRLPDNYIRGLNAVYSVVIAHNLYELTKYNGVER